MTLDQARAAALRLDCVVEAAHHGHPDFRVKNKIFATLWPAKGTSALCLPPEMAVTLAGDDPETFRAMPSTPKTGWVVVNLSGIRHAEYKRLLQIAHRRVLGGMD